MRWTVTQPVGSIGRIKASNSRQLQGRCILGEAQKKVPVAHHENGFVKMGFTEPDAMSDAADVGDVVLRGRVVVVREEEQSRQLAASALIDSRRIIHDE